MYRRLPNSMSAVIRTLTTARDTYALTIDPADRAIGTDLFAKLDEAVPASLLNRLIKEANRRDEAQSLYTEAQALAVDICDTVEFFYRKDPDPASRRAKCRRWSVVYITEPGETPDPGTESAANTTLNTPAATPTPPM